jgi:hypothetical protein
MKFSSQFRGKMPQEHVEPEKIPSNRKSEQPPKMKRVIRKQIKKSRGR